ncbi:extracellular solute-binding protein [Pullulanibacillus sp. KACC 23026]|uniref:extracellular solute-binding protein n=1 Tax=Pullulanibacillus sp. KACC 23026 TaxID=3028315 RepID=UPI0023AE8BAF|nr:extracellular solute-binding protein [Pullulanibacillus sp. KACC 23026]WEG13699.1 extracellular solute-binding protein [Pullulanibacillus sp. KACC 23026]
MNRPMKKSLSILFSASLLAGALTACGNAKDTSSNADSKGPMKLTIMMPSFDQNLATDNSPIVKKLDKETNTKIHLQWVPNDSYPDKFNVTLASGNLPDIMVLESMNGGFAKAAEAGEFWDLGPYLKDYPNLSKLNPIVEQNASVNGTLYGIPRLRALGRNGLLIRQDWLKKLGLQEPKTIDDFYNILKAFKNDDPDGDGKNDTYGMTISQFNGPWDVMQTWFGVPNQWGKASDGSLKPYFEFPQYQTALDFFKKLYDEKLINQDFAAMPSSKWYDDIEADKSGVIVDVADSAHRIEDKIDTAKFGANATTEQKESKTFMTVLGGVAGPDGQKHYLPTDGYSGELVIPKTTVKTEAQLKKVLKFLNQLNDKDLQVLLGNGIEGKQYTLDDNGYAVPSTDQGVVGDLHDLNQMLMFLPEDKTIKTAPSPLTEKETKVQNDNEQYVVANPAAGLLSQTYAQKGAQLDQIITDARVKYISGQIDKAGLQDAIKQWKAQGGDQYTKEINDLYKKEQSKK